VRERVTFAPDTLSDALRDLVGARKAKEAAILSTCNRTEVYFHGGSPEPVARWLEGVHRWENGRIVWQTERLVEAPNFSPDGSYLLVNGDGLLYRIALDDKTEIQHVDTGSRGGEEYRETGKAYEPQCRQTRPPSADANHLTL